MKMLVNSLRLTRNTCVLISYPYQYLQEERLLRMGDELNRLASYESECHRKDGVIAALRDEVADLKATLQPCGSIRYIMYSV